MELWTSAVTIDRAERGIVHTWEVDATLGRLSLWLVPPPKSRPRFPLSDTHIPTHLRRTTLEVRGGLMSFTLRPIDSPRTRRTEENERTGHGIQL